MQDCGISHAEGVEFEVQNGIPATLLQGLYVGASLAACAVLLAGLLALAIHPMVGALLAIGGMALLLYAAAGFCREPGIKKLLSRSKE